MTIVKPGRPKGSRNRRHSELLEMARLKGADPVDFLLSLISEPTIALAQVDESGEVIRARNGKPVLKHVPVTLEQKLDACKTVAPYMYARLQAAQISASVDVDVTAQAHFPTDRILADPRLTDALTDLAFLMMADDTAPRALPPPGQLDRVVGD